MASYKYAAYISNNQSDEFDKEYGPGKIVPFSGIYRCMGCGREIAANQENPFPPQNHHQHTQAQGAIRWRLIVYAVHQPQ